MELRSGRLMALAAAAGMAGEWAAVPDELEKMAQAKMRFAAMAGTEARVNMRGQHPLAKRIRYHAQRHSLPRDWLTAADEVLGTWHAVTLTHAEIGA